MAEVFSLVWKKHNRGCVLEIVFLGEYCYIEINEIRSKQMSSTELNNISILISAFISIDPSEASPSSVLGQKKTNESRNMRVISYTWSYKQVRKSRYACLHHTFAEACYLHWVNNPIIPSDNTFFIHNNTLFITFIHSLEYRIETQ